MSCTINNKRCTMCCKAIVLPMSASDVFKKIRKRKQYHGELIDDLTFIIDSWININRRRAKKINPHLVVEHKRRAKSESGKTKVLSKLSYWTCKHLTLDGCGIYEKRPDVCRNYPVYPSYTKEQIKNIASMVPEYHPECSEWPKIEAVNIYEPVEAFQKK